MRKCSRCEVLTEDFRAGRNVCRDCERADARPRSAKRYAAYRDEILAADRRLREADPEPSRAKNRASYERHRDKRIAAVKAWASANGDKRRAIARRHSNKRRALMFAAFVEPVEPLVVLERDDGTCGICGADVDPTNFHVDHIVPLTKGGTHGYANVQAAHPACNIGKNARLMFEEAA